MSGSAAAMALTLVAGLAMGMQVVINAALGRRIGVAQAGSFSAFLTAALLLLAVIVTR